MRWRPLSLLATGLLLITLPACSDDAGPPIATGTPIQARPDSEVVALVPRVVRTIPHDTDAFTQGLEVDGDTLVESTGLYGKSRIRRLATSDGAVLEERDLDDDLFAEGLTRVGDRWIQLTWLEHVALVHDEALREVDRIELRGEGWGLCFDGEVLHHSDGSAVLRQRDPDDLAEVGSVTVTLDGRPQAQLNELECVDGTVWANVWHTNTILGIDADTGEVTRVVDATSLAEQVEVGNPSEDVLNGIAFDEATGHFWVTGKSWPTLFEVELVPAD